MTSDRVELDPMFLRLLVWVLSVSAANSALLLVICWTPVLLAEWHGSQLHNILEMHASLKCH